MRELFNTIADMLPKEKHEPVENLMSRLHENIARAQRLRDCIINYQIDSFTYEEYDKQFDAMLDNMNEPVTVMGKKYKYSEVAKEMDWRLYSQELQSYAELEFAFGNHSETYKDYVNDLQECEDDILKLRQQINERQNTNEGAKQ